MSDTKIEKSIVQVVKSKQTIYKYEKYIYVIINKLFKNLGTNI